MIGEAGGADGEPSPQISVILFCATHKKPENAFQDWL
jgi:hypothetical protein